MDKTTAREVQILKQIPKTELQDFIERNAERMRDLLWDEEWFSNLEIIEELANGYRWL
jgi:hypothetical protein